MKPKRPHRLEFNKRAGRQVCIRCGTVQLRNDKTNRALRAACADDLYDHNDHQKG